MKANPILEEVWRVKEQLAANANYDMDVFLNQLREWSESHPPSAPVVHDADELRHLASEIEPLAVREHPDNKYKTR
jgi:hypothetical protein